VITCYTKYIIDPAKLNSFESYTKMLLPVIKRLGGMNITYLLPYEGPNNVAYELCDFPNLAAYEQYRETRKTDTDYQGACKFVEKSGCILSYERSFLRPLSGD